jgi:DNA-binding LacI/PurR family transcriptional regulator
MNPSYAAQYQHSTRSFDDCPTKLRRYRRRDDKTPPALYHYDHHSEIGGESSVTVTNRRGMREALRHLLALGHRRIGFIKGWMDIACSHDRFRGYHDGLDEVRLPFDPTLVGEGEYLRPSDFQQAQILLECDDPPTAILTSNDMMVFGIMDTVRKANLYTLGATSQSLALTTSIWQNDRIHR